MSANTVAAARSVRATELPQALTPFLRFATVLRENGFAIAPEQTQNFIAAVELLGPRSMGDIHLAAIALFGPAPERREEFDALFHLVFMGQTLAAPAHAPSDDDTLQAFDSRDGQMEPPDIGDTVEAGAAATTAERLAARGFDVGDDNFALRQLRRRAPTELPVRRSRRWSAQRHGTRPDMRRSLREAVRRDGEVLRLPAMARRTRMRRIILLIDVSGSMKALTEGHLRFAHTLIASSDRCEVFTLGTRLTRISRALRLRHQEQALAAVGGIVADWDGGTRLGDALGAFLAVPRFAGFARGALVIVLSDGLERGDHASLVDAVARLSRLAWSVLWLNPLANDPDFIPETAAMRAMLPYVDRLGPGANLRQLSDEVLSFAKRARA